MGFSRHSHRMCLTIVRYILYRSDIARCPGLRQADIIVQVKKVRGPRPVARRKRKTTKHDSDDEASSDAHDDEQTVSDDSEDDQSSIGYPEESIAELVDEPEVDELSVTLESLHMSNDKTSI